MGVAMGVFQMLETLLNHIRKKSESKNGPEFEAEIVTHSSLRNGTKPARVATTFCKLNLREVWEKGPNVALQQFSTAYSVPLASRSNARAVAERAVYVSKLCFSGRPVAVAGLEQKTCKCLETWAKHTDQPKYEKTIEDMWSLFPHLSGEGC